MHFAVGDVPKLIETLREMYPNEEDHEWLGNELRKLVAEIRG